MDHNIERFTLCIPLENGYYNTSKKIIITYIYIHKSIHTSILELNTKVLKSISKEIDISENVTSVKSGL